MNYKSLFVVVSLVASLFAAAAHARDNGATQHGCPAAVSDKLDAEFGVGAQAMTRCIENRRNVKVFYQINQVCANAACDKPYGLGNIQNALNDYNGNYGMTINKDYEIAIVVHGDGGKLLIKDSVLRAKGMGTNPFESKITSLIDQGVKVYFCQNTVRSLMPKFLTPGNVTAEIIPGVKFATSGVTTIADLQAEGWSYIQP